MDAFEARLQFTSRLSKLSASIQAAKSCAQFALKHKEYHEDLHSCILEQLASVRRIRILIYLFIYLSLAYPPPPLPACLLGPHEHSC